MARKKKTKTRLLRTLLFIYCLPFLAAVLLVLTTNALILVYGD
jgi:hypothetical protein